MTMPLISIITVVYNGGATLEKTIRSVTRQIYPCWEYIIVDGGSRDGTLDIIHACKGQITKYVSEPDKGVYDAMNKGIRMAGGEWILFLGSDDVFADEKVLAAVFGDIDHTGCDLLYGNVISTSYKGPYDGEFTFEKLLSRNISHQAIFYKKSLFDRIGDYNLRYRAHADWDLNIRCFADKSIRVKYMDIIVAEFGAGGISSQHDVPFLREVLVPEKLRMLAVDGSSRLRKVQAYDEWWRMIRNAGIRHVRQLEEFAGAEKRPIGSLPGVQIPRCIKRMVRWQRPVPQQVLRMGAFSKSLMFASYLINRLTGAI
jgi:glycosyltransferase involved in cell wall biosynthesis